MQTYPTVAQTIDYSSLSTPSSNSIASLSSTTAAAAHSSSSSSSSSSWLGPVRSLTLPTERTDRYQWAKANGIFITREEILPYFLSTQRLQELLIIDTRDDDALGGHIKSAVSYPDSTFNQRIDELYTLILERKPQLIILHCMESIRRGPRCAYRLIEYFQHKRDNVKEPSMIDGKDSNTYVPLPRMVRVLQGGADGWLRNYYLTGWVEDFDNEYWGWNIPSSTMKEELKNATIFDESITNKSVIVEQNISVARTDTNIVPVSYVPTHRNYVRPADQLME